MYVCCCLQGGREAQRGAHAAPQGDNPSYTTTTNNNTSRIII